MLQITVTDKNTDIPDDELRRAFVGYEPGMSDEDMYEANHGCWHLGEKAEGEHYVLFKYSRDGLVKQAVAIDHIADTPSGKRRVVHGTVLTAGHPVYDKFVGKLAPVQGNRNPVVYFDDTVGAVPCRCGCGGVTERGDFLPGHDQTALHARVKQIGTVAEFLDWFDNVRGNTKPTARASR